MRPKKQHFRKILPEMQLHPADIYDELALQFLVFYERSLLSPDSLP
jgi:hypothetical protein